MITIEENDTAHYSPLGNADQCKGTAEHNSVKECSTGDLTLNSKGDTSARNRPHLKAGRVGSKKTSTQIQVWVQRREAQ